MRWLLCLIPVVLAACSDGKASTESVAQRKAKRIEAAEERLSKAPIPRTYRYSDGELRVIQPGVRDGSGYLDTHRCFIWRDTEYRTTSISCANEPDITPAIE